MPAFQLELGHLSCLHNQAGAVKDYIFIQTTANEFEAVEIQISQSNNEYVSVSNTDAKSWVGKSLVVKNAFSILGKWMNKSE